MNATATHLLERLPRPRRSTVLVGLALVNVEALFVLTYVAVVERPLLDPFLVYPWIWLNVGAWLLLRTDPPAAGARTRRIAAAVAVGYFLVLAFASNMLALDLAGDAPAFGWDFKLYAAPPGWTPSLHYTGPYLTISLVPPYVVGFAALTYLVYATVLDASGLAGVGLVGIFSCVTCSLPLVAAVVTGVAGGSTATLLAAVAPIAYPLGTAIFLLTAGLLYWHPGAVGAG